MTTKRKVEKSKPRELRALADANEGAETNAGYYTVAIKEAVKPIVVEAMNVIAKVHTNGFPPKGVVNNGVWHGESLRRDLTEDEITVVARLALQIEMLVRESFARLILNDGFRETLRKDLLHGLRLKGSKTRSTVHTKPFVDVLKVSPAITEKALLKLLEEKGVLVDAGTHYAISGSDVKIKKATMASKISRMRAGLRT